MCGETQPSRKAEAKGRGDLVSQCWEGKDIVLIHEVVYVKNISIFSCGLKLVMHVKYIKVVFVVSPFIFLPKAAAKGLSSKARFPGVLKW